MQKTVQLKFYTNIGHNRKDEVINKLKKLGVPFELKEDEYDNLQLYLPKGVEDVFVLYPVLNENYNHIEWDR